MTKSMKVDIPGYTAKLGPLSCSLNWPEDDLLPMTVEISKQVCSVFSNVALIFIRVMMLWLLKFKSMQLNLGPSIQSWYTFGVM